MRKAVTIFLLLVSLYTQAQDSTWTQWSWLIGEWHGEGNGRPGPGSGTFSFQPDLGRKILLRKAHSEYDNNGQHTIHDDLLIVYLDMVNSAPHAIYFDNEGHSLNYSVNYSGKNIILTSEKVGNLPIFRLTYTLIDANTVDTKFELSQDGTNFATYVEGRSKKGRL